MEFILLPMPRLEVETVADMKVLFEIGALTPDMSLQLSHIMLGEDIENKRRRIQLERGGMGAKAGGNENKMAMMTPEDIQAAKGGGWDKKKQDDKAGKKNPDDKAGKKKPDDKAEKKKD